MISRSLKATLAASINALTFSSDETVPLVDVMRHRQTFAQMIDAWHSDTDASIEAILAAAARCAALGCNAPMAKVLEVRRSDNVLVVKAQFGLSEEALGRSAGKVDPVNPAGEALANAEPVIEPDVRRRPQEKLPQILLDYGVVTSVSLPLINHIGPYGILEVDYREPTEFGAFELSFLASVAGALAESIEKYHARSSLAADRDAKVDLLREQQHRIRNNFQLIVAMLQRNARQAEDPQVRSSFRDVERRVFAMASLYDHLLGLGQHGEQIDLGRYLGSMADSFHEFYGLRENRITLQVDLESGVLLSPDICTTIGTVVNELVANAVEHAFGGERGRIKISLRQQPQLAICVVDDGKGFDASASENVGLQTIRRIAMSIGAKLEHRSETGHGTVCELTLPGHASN